ncbi:hypothetical protein FCM35_KLT02600 [Carex littledalei]|uniref:Uncharacterized protein n=1 Tax=Carex littledalei TaxID=544730 RepID=A0A833RDN3_9POAL|nr:hypothetical protein FCM35_KLT02600 [Carex littledalei]
MRIESGNEVLVRRNCNLVNGLVRFRSTKDINSDLKKMAQKRGFLQFLSYLLQLLFNFQLHHLWGSGLGVWGWSYKNWKSCQTQSHMGFSILSFFNLSVPISKWKEM